MEKEMKIQNIAIPCLLICLIWFSCKDKSTEPSVKFEGITETLSSPDAIGAIDTNDWRPMMNCSPAARIVHFSMSDTVPPVQIDTTRRPTCTKIFPAYPNPASGSFNIEYSLNAADSVYMTLNDSPTGIRKEIIKERQSSGLYLVRVDASDLRPGIYRIYITAFCSTGVLQSYGDVEIVE